MTAPIPGWEEAAAAIAPNFLPDCVLCAALIDVLARCDKLLSMLLQEV